MMAQLPPVLQSDAVVAAVLSVLLTALLGVLARLFVPRGRLKWSVSHFYNFSLPPPPQPSNPGSGQAPQGLLVRTADVWVQNVGRGPVTGVEITLNYPPQHYEIWPQRAYQQSVNPAGKLIVRVESLGRREFFTIAMIDVLRDLPMVLTVRSDAGAAGNVVMAPTRIFPQWANAVAAILIAVGLISAIFWLIRIVQLLL